MQQHTRQLNIGTMTAKDGYFAVSPLVGAISVQRCASDIGPKPF